MLYQKYSVVINKYQCETNRRIKWKNKLMKKKPWFPKLFYVIISLKYPPVRFGIFFILCHIKINKMTSYSQSKNGCNTQHYCRIRSENQSQNQGNQIECRLDTVVTFRIAKIVFVMGPIYQDSSLKEAKSDIREAGCKETISFRIRRKLIETVIIRSPMKIGQ